MSSAAATACTCTPRCRLNRTAASLNSALYSRTFFGPARGTDTSRWLGGSVYKSEGGFPVSFERLLGCPLSLALPSHIIEGMRFGNTPLALHVLCEANPHRVIGFMRQPCSHSTMARSVDTPSPHPGRLGVRDEEHEPMPLPFSLDASLA